MIIELSKDAFDKVAEIQAKEPCQVWYDLNRIVVYTGADIPKSEASRKISSNDFRDRFTDAELVGIAKLAYSGTGDVNASVLLLKVATATEIDLDAPAVASGLGYLVAKNVITATRKNEILK